MNHFYTVLYLVYLEFLCVFASNNTITDREDANPQYTTHNETNKDIHVSFAIDQFEKNRHEIDDSISNIANHKDAPLDSVPGKTGQERGEHSVYINNYNTFVSERTHDGGNLTDSDNATSTIMYDHILLPQSLRPRLYNITFQPHVDVENPINFTFSCETIIHIDCINSTELILLHSVGHEITYISIENETEPVEIKEWWTNADLQMLMLKPGYVLRAGHNYILTFRSISQVSGSLRGFYYSPYRDGNQTKYIFTTMMEPTDARSVFPCFDEPDFKAVFIFNIKRKEGDTSLTNLPKRITLGPDAEGFFTDVFDEPRNVPMSSYLVAIAIGDLDYLESTVNNVTFRTWCRRSEVNKTRFALEIGMKFMEFFEDYFQIPYPLPKEDMIAVPTMSFSGMEHWGLITYRETMMLYEEGVSSLDEKEMMTIIIAHEMAHQWFGNLVSPFWWDDLWLNEGFATYMMFLAVERVLPSWNMENKLIVDTRGAQNVMRADDDHNTHPVYVSVYNPDDIHKIFDLISYAKGGSVIRMMNFFLGEDTFRRGLTRYLKAFSYRTATHNDLWNSLSEQSEIDKHTNTDVKAVMDTWIHEENYPVVTMTLIDNSTIELTQAAFLDTEEQRQRRSNVTWTIPFVYTTDIDRNFDKTFVDITWITDKTAHITDERLENASWVIGNLQQYGFYRVNYDEHNWNALLGQLLSDCTVIHPINRAQIINDAWNLARAGLLDMRVALHTLDYLDSELDFVPWKAALRELNIVELTLQLTSLYGDFENFMRKTLEKAYFSTAGASDHYGRLTYSMIAKAACEFGLEVCINDIMEKFTAWKQDDNVRVDPDLKEVVYCTGVRTGGREEWGYVLLKFIVEDSTSEKNALLNALTCTQTPWILRLLTDMVFEKRAFSRTQQISVMEKLSKTPIGRLMVWNIFEENWDTIRDEYGDDLYLFTGVISAITGPYNSLSEINKLKAFVRQQKDLGSAKSIFERAIDNTQFNMEWLNKYQDTLKSWLREEI